MNAVCPNTIPGKWNNGSDGAGRTQFYNWPCVLADRHPGDCEPSREWDSHSTPFRLWDRDRLLGQLYITDGQLRAERRARREAFERDVREHRSEALLLHRVLQEGTGRTGKHDRDCWRRHTTCLARLLLAPDRIAEVLAADDTPPAGAQPLPGLDHVATAGA